METSTSCSLTPSSARAESTASSTLGALLWISSTTASGPWLPPLRARTRPTTPRLPSRARSRRSGLPAVPLLLGPRHHRSDDAPAFRLPIRGSGGQALSRRSRSEHVVLLTDLPQVRRRPIHHQSLRKEDPEHDERDRQDPQDRLLLRRSRARRARLLHLTLLEVGRPKHGGHEHVVGDPVEGASAVHRVFQRDRFAPHRHPVPERRVLVYGV